MFIQTHMEVAPKIQIYKNLYNNVYHNLVSPKLFYRTLDLSHPVNNKIGFCPSLYCDKMGVIGGEGTNK